MHQRDLPTQKVHVLKTVTAGLSNKATWYQYGFSKPQGPIDRKTVSGDDVRQVSQFLLRRARVRKPDAPADIVIFSRTRNRRIVNEDELLGTAGTEQGAGQDRAGQDRTGQDRAGQGRIGQGRAGQGRVGRKGKRAVAWESCITDDVMLSAAQMLFGSGTRRRRRSWSGSKRWASRRRSASSRSPRSRSACTDRSSS